MKAARIFLYIVAFLTVLVMAIFFVMRIWSDELSEMVFVPDGDYVEQQPLETNAYHDPDMWLSRPGMGVTDPARWQPAYAPAEQDSESSAEPAAPDMGDVPQFAVFFIHPTSYMEKTSWNAPLDNVAANEVASQYVHAMASPFNKASEIWAPRYRQATFGTFLTADPKADQALDAAYRDVDQAFTFFLDSVDDNVPIVLAGHSQGSVHLLRLLRERIAGTPLQNRIAMAYAIGWPISIKHDLPALGLPACATPDQASCLVSWMSFAEPADPHQMLSRYNEANGFDGEERAGSAFVCTNPISGVLNGKAPAEDNLGTLVPDLVNMTGQLVPGAVPARCDSQGILLIGDPPELGPAVLPGNNYHVYDIPLFWANLQADVVHRVEAWQASR